MGRSLLGLGMAAMLVTLLGCCGGYGCRMCDDCQDYAPPVVNSVPAGTEYYESVSEVGTPSQRVVTGPVEGVPTEATRGSDQGSSRR